MDKGPPHANFKKWAKDPPAGPFHGRILGICGAYSRPSSSSSQREATASDGIRLVGAGSRSLASARGGESSLLPPRLLSPRGPLRWVPAGPPMGDWRRITPDPPAPPARGRPRRQTASASSARAPDPSLPPGGAKARSFRRASSPHGDRSAGSPRGPQWATGGGGGSYSRPSSSSSQREATASDGIRQSPRGLRATEPTLGPSGRQERLNCWEKNRR